jgi:hypothetical protein
MFKRLQNRRASVQDRKVAGVSTFNNMSKEQYQIFSELESAQKGLGLVITPQDLRFVEKTVEKLMVKYAPGFDISHEVEDILNNHAIKVGMLGRQTLLQISKLIHDSLLESIEMNTIIDPRSDWENR